MPLFEIPKEEVKVKETKTKIKLKKGQTLTDLINQAEMLVNEKLAKYKDASRCITNIDDLKKFFDDTPDGSEIGVDSETTRFKYISR